MKARTTAIQRRLAIPRGSLILTTPPYPDYTSGANGVTGATTAHPHQLYFGKDDMTFTITSEFEGGKEKTRNYNKLLGLCQRYG